MLNRRCEVKGWVCMQCCWCFEICDGECEAEAVQVMCSEEDVPSQFIRLFSGALFPKRRYAISRSEVRIAYYRLVRYMNETLRNRGIKLEGLLVAANVLPYSRPFSEHSDRNRLLWRCTTPLTIYWCCTNLFRGAALPKLKTSLRVSSSPPPSSKLGIRVQRHLWCFERYYRPGALHG